MKKIFTILITAIVATNGFSQVGNATWRTSYQAVIRNSANELVQNSPIGIKISILDESVTGTAIYVETHTKQTNQNGLLDLQIGGGTVVSGEFNNGLFGLGIYWGQPHFLKTEIDPLGGTNYTITSTSELLSVPVSNYAHVSGSLHGRAWQFVGAYVQVNPVPNTPGSFEGYSFMNYLGVDKVSWTWKIQANPGSQESEHTLYGTVFNNVVTFPQQVIQGDTYPQAIGTLVGNNLTITGEFGDVIEFVKQ